MSKNDVSYVAKRSLSRVSEKLDFLGSTSTGEEEKVPLDLSNPFEVSKAIKIIY